MGGGRSGPRGAARPDGGAANAGLRGVWLRLGRAAVLTLGFAIAASLFAISALMNFRFGTSLGADVSDQLLYGWASLSADGFKALLPFLIIGLWRSRRWLLVTAAGALWGLCVAWSLASAVGFASTTRDAAAAERRAVQSEAASLRQRAARLEAQIAQAGPQRDPAAVAAEIDAVGVPRGIWRRTDRCRDVTLPASLDACQPVLELRRERAAAEAAARRETELAEVRAALSRITPSGSIADPQARAIAALLGETPDAVRAALALVMTGLIELGSSLGFTLVAAGAGALRGAPRGDVDVSAADAGPGEAADELERRFRPADRKTRTRQRPDAAVVTPSARGASGASASDPGAPAPAPPLGAGRRDVDWNQDQSNFDYASESQDPADHIDSDDGDGRPGSRSR